MMVGLTMNRIRVSPKAAMKASTAGCGTRSQGSPSGTKVYWSRGARLASSGRASSGTASISARIRTRTPRPAPAEIERSVSQASRARSSGSRSAMAANTTRPGDEKPASGARTSARSAAKRTRSPMTSWRRLNRQPRRSPTAKTTHEYTPAKAATGSRSAADCRTTVAPSSSAAPGPRWGRSLSRCVRYCAGGPRWRPAPAPAGLGLTWELKDTLPAAKRVYYGKLLKGRPLLVALDLFPAFYALIRGRQRARDYRVEYEAGRLSHTARRIMDAMLDEHPQYTGELRANVFMLEPAKTREL